MQLFNDAFPVLIGFVCGVSTLFALWLLQIRNEHEREKKRRREVREWCEIMDRISLDRRAKK